MKRSYFTGLAAFLVSSVLISGAFAKPLTIVGSSTVFPFATTVAEEMSRGQGYRSPVIEATGTGGGMKLFCAGVGEKHPDIVNASRRMKQAEYNGCKSRGVTPIEVFFGYDGIVLANSKKGPVLRVTKKQLFLALAKNLMVQGEMKPNPYKYWSDISSSLPNIPIKIYGPPPTSGTRDAFLELVMEVGGSKVQWLALQKKLSHGKRKFKNIAHQIREDGAYVEAGENDNLIIRKLESQPEAYGIFGFSFLDQNSDKIQGAEIDGVAPDYDTVSSQQYKVARPLYFYLKGEHWNKEMNAYYSLFVDDRMSGEEGRLIDKGLIPLDEDTMNTEKQKVSNKLAEL